MKWLAVALALLSASTAAGAQDSDRVQISLRRTVCFGTCPDYAVTLDGEGSVTYDGRQFVRVVGRHTWKIDPALVRALAAEMQKAGFFDWDSQYTAPVTDLPSTYTTLTIGTRTKTIKDYFGAPRALKEIEARIDDVSGAKGYVRVSGAAIREMRQKGWLATGDDARAWMNEAAYSGDDDVVRALLAAGFSARTADGDGVTLVMRAARSGNPAAVRALLAAGGDPTARDRWGRNAADRARDGIANTAASPGQFVEATGRPRDYEAVLRLLTDEDLEI